MFVTVLCSQEREKEIPAFINYFENESSNAAQSHLLQSQYYTNPRKVIIQLPLSYTNKTQKKYPVLYLLDGERNIKSLTHIANTLASKHKMPEIIIVAIPASTTRQQDYTPNDIPMHSSTALGHAKTFTKFLQEELIPFIDTHFRTDPYRILSGHSRGGLFAFNDLLDQTHIFQAHFAFSPALWAGNFTLIDRASQQLSHKNLKSSFLYINAGGEEGDNIKTAFHKFEQLLQEHRPAQWHATFHENDSHGTTPIPGHYLALRKLYANWDKPWELFDSQGLDAVITQHHLLSKEFGYRVIPDEDDLDKLGNYYLQKGNITLAIKTLKLNMEYHSYSVNAHDHYAGALEKNGSYVLALEVMEKARSLIKGKPSKAITDRYNSLKQKISKTQN